MAEKVAEAGVKRKTGYLYFVDNDGDVSRVERGEEGEIGKEEKVAKVGIDKENGYLYFVDKDGDISRVKMARGRK